MKKLRLSGLRVRCRITPNTARTCSGVDMALPKAPRPPASDTAIASSGVEGPAMGASRDRVFDLKQIEDLAVGPLGHLGRVHRCVAASAFFKALLSSKRLVASRITAPMPSIRIFGIAERDDRELNGDARAILAHGRHRQEIARRVAGCPVRMVLA